MGRKIPGKKHRGVKDPEKQQLKRHNLIKGKINAPPLNPDSQEISKSALRIAELKERVKSGNKKVQRKVANPLLARHKGENREKHLQRISKVCDTLVQESNYEVKFGVKVKRSETTGEIEKIEKVPENKQLAYERKQLKEQRRKKKKKKQTDELPQPKISKSQKKKRKLLLKMENKKIDKEINFIESRRDEVKFGEVVHAPPTLSLPKKAANLKSAPRPGQKSLLLKSLLVKNVQSNVTKKTKVGEIDKAGKRKNLPGALRRQLEKNQSEIIKAYRDLKKNKTKLQS